MKRALLPAFLFAVLAFSLPAQERVTVIFKVFPADYELFYGGERLPYSPRGEGLRAYALPPGTARVNLSSQGSAPLSLAVEAKAGAVVEGKLEPRQGPLNLVGEAATGKSPRSVSFSADGKKLLVALQGEPGVDVFEVPSLKKLPPLAVGSPAPGGFTDVFPVGKDVWAVQKDGRVHLFDGTTLAFKESSSVTRGGNALLDNVGTKIVVSNWDDSVLTLVDIATKKPEQTLALGGSLRGFTFSKGVGYASLFDRGQVAVIDGATWKVKSLWSVGKAPRPVAVAGDTLFVGDMGSASVLLLDRSGKLLRSVSVPSNPHEMTVSPDQTLVAVASRGKNNAADYLLPGPDFGRVTLLDAKGNVQGTVWGRNQPTGLAFSPDGKYLAFTDLLDDNVELYRVVTKGP